MSDQSSYLDTIQPFTGGLTVREWMAQRNEQLARVVLELEAALAKYSTTQGRIHLERALSEARPAGRAQGKAMSEHLEHSEAARAVAFAIDKLAQLRAEDALVDPRLVASARDVLAEKLDALVRPPLFVDPSLAQARVVLALERQ